MCRVNAQLQSSHGEDSSDEPSPYPHHHHHHQQQQQQQQQPSPHPDREMMDTQAVSRPFSVLADRHAVLLRVATATLHTAAAANAAAPAPGDPDAGAAAAAETICLVDRHRSDLPPITGADLSSSDDCPPSAAATASPTTTPSPRRACPSIAVHSTRAAPASADDEVFRAVGGGATLTVDTCLADARFLAAETCLADTTCPAADTCFADTTCLADGRPSLSSSADGQTDLTRLSASDDSPQPDLRPSAASTSTIRPQIKRENGKCQRV